MEKALKSAGIDYEKVAGGGLYETSIQLKSASKEQLEQAQKFYDAWLDQENAFNQASINGYTRIYSCCWSSTNCYSNIERFKVITNSYYLYLYCCEFI